VADLGGDTADGLCRVPEEIGGALKAHLADVGGGRCPYSLDQALGECGAGQIGLVRQPSDGPWVGGLAWMALMASPMTGAMTPVNQAGVASGQTAQARRVWMNSRSRIRESISRDPCDGLVFSCISRCGRAPRRGAGRSRPKGEPAPVSRPG
jgi:hypothetical protein